MRQNTGQPAKIITLVEHARLRHGDSLASLMRDAIAWERLVCKTEAVVRTMHLWKLQTVGKEKLNFLYGDGDQDGSIELRPGIAYCFREFYSSIRDVVRSAWLRDVRALNGDLLGEALDLREFLFGAERKALPGTEGALCGQAGPDGPASCKLGRNQPGSGIPEEVTPVLFILVLSQRP